MARRRIIISSSGGIAAGSPFALGGGLFVQQASPPVAFTQRLKLTEPIDANQGIEAPGVFAGVGSLVLGRGVTDAANGARAILIGDTISVNGTGGATMANDQVMVGNTIVVPTGATNTQNLVVLGNSVTFVSVGGFQSFGGSVAIGKGITISCSATTDAQNVVAIGQGALVTEAAGIAIGSAATVSKTEGIAIGQSTLAGSQSVAVGARANVGATSVGIGRGALGGTDCVAIGFTATSSGAVSSIAIGRQASVLGATGAMAFGQGATNTVDHWALFGSPAFPITTMRFGAGLNDATGNVVYTFQTADVFGGAGNNLAGNTLILAAGVGTGNWANAENRGLDLQVGLAVAGGSAQQTYTSVLAMRHSDLNVALWGGLSAPFSGGKGVLFIKNAATNPTVAAVAGGGILSVQGGQLHFLSSGGVDTALTPGGGGGGTTLLLANNTFAQAKNSVGTARNVLGIDGSDRVLVGSLSESPLRLQSVGAVEVSASALNPQTAGAATLGAGGQEWGGLFISVNGATSLVLTNQVVTAGAAAGTLTNAPSAGNPVGYLQISINGTVRKVPFW